MRRKGFTLIELLVVIAIIAILAAILFPVFARARAKARQACCLSNLKQIGLGILQYAGDFDEQLPDPYNWGGEGVWTVKIAPYLKNQQILNCPDAKPKGTVQSYGMSWLLHYYGSSGRGLGGGDPLAYILHPAETIMACDTEPLAPGGWYAAKSGLVYAPGHARECPPSTRHNDMANFVFVDGHAKCMGNRAWDYPKELWGLTDGLMLL